MPLFRLLSIDAKKVETVVAEITAFGGEAIGVAGDVAADDFPKRTVDATVQSVLLPLPLFPTIPRVD